MVASILERAGVPLVHNRAGANMAGGIASTLLAATRPGGGIDGEIGLFEVDEFWLDRVTPELRPRAILLGNLFRDQLDRYGELETIADRWAAVVASLPRRRAARAERRRSADRRPRPRPRRRHATSASRTTAVALPEMQHASDSKHCRRCGAAYVYETIYLGHLGRYRCPSCGQERPSPAIAAERIELRRDPGGELHAAHAAGAASPSSCRSRVSTTSTTRSVPPRCACASASRSSDVVAGLNAVTAAFGRAETGRDRGRRAVDPARQEPGGCERDPAHARARAGRARRARDPQRPHGRRPGRLVGVGCRLRDPRLAGAPHHLRRHPRRRARAALQVRRRRRRASARRPEPVRARSTTRSPTTPGGRLFALPTYTALLELRDELAAPRARRPSSGNPTGPATAHERDLARPRVRDLRRGPARSGARSRSEHGDPVLDVGAGTGRVALDLARSGHRVTALDSDPELLAELDARADGSRARHGDRRRARVRSRRGGSRCASCRCRRSSCSVAATAGSRSCAARAAIWPAAACSRSRSPRSSSCTRSRDGVPGPLPDICERDGIVYSSQPTAVRADARRFVLERRRETIARARRAIGRART